MVTSIGGRHVAYDEIGAGRPLLLLHAFPFDRRCWGKVAPAIARRHRVIAPDFRGFGDSELGPSGYSIADLADDVAALMESLGLPRAAVCGLSMGGYVALALARRHPDRLAALILADTKAGAETSEARGARDQAIARVRGEGVTAYVESVLPRLLAPDATVQVRDEVRALAAQPAAAVLAALAALRDRPDRRTELGLISCPTLVVVGADDVVTPPAEAAAMAQAIKGAVLATMPGAGHLPNLETPQSFASAVVDFL